MYTYTERSHRNTRIRHQTAALTAGLVLAVILTLAGSSRLHSVQASDAYPTSTCYTSVYVSAGDTLWDIADEYMDSGWSDKASYIAEVRSINHLTDDRIMAGAYIIVPYTVPDI